MRRIDGILVVATLVASATVTAMPLRVSQALFTDAQAVPNNAFTTGTWVITTYYLHNNPTPPTANTNRQANLPLDSTAPTATVLRNYDQNADSAAGRMIGKGGSVSTTDLVIYQNWRSPALTSARTIDGTVSVVFWSAIKDFGTGKAGSVQAFLRAFNPVTSTYTTIGSGTLSASNWQASSTTWVQKTLTFNVADVTVAAGQQLDLRLVVGGSAGDDMWFAYDTTSYPSRLVLP